jgi:hypothetical protein
MRWAEVEELQVGRSCLAGVEAEELPLGRSWLVGVGELQRRSWLLVEEHRSQEEALRRRYVPSIQAGTNSPITVRL